MEAYEDSEHSLKPINEQVHSELSTTAKKLNKRPNSEKKAGRNRA